MKIPYITKQQMTEVDRLMIEKYKISVTQMMEIAGFNTAVLTKRLLATSKTTSIKNKSILILAGKGNNGGDGICAARYLYNWGANVTLFLITEDIKKEPLHHLQIAKKTNITIIKSFSQLQSSIQSAHIVIDALLGYNLKGDPKGRYATAIETMNSSKKTILSIDIPSGQSAEGLCSEPCTNATYTLCLSLPKVGSEKGNFGDTYVTDMGVLPEVYKDMKLKVPPLFKEDFIIRL
jgi:NAD(P)H-hydrate epimerase